MIRAAYGVSFIHFNRLGGENLLAYNLPFILNPIVDSQRPPLAANGQPVCTSPAQGPNECFRPTMQGYPNNFLSLANIRPLNVRTNMIPFDTRSGFNRNFHVSVQQELGAGWVVDVGYVGTRGGNLMILGDFNQARPNNAGENVPLQLRRPLQNFGFIQTAFDGGYLDYNAFQAKVEKRFSSGFYFLNSFTASHAEDNASGHLEASSGDNSRVNFRNLESERGTSGYDQPFNNTTTLLYDLPFGNGRRFGSDLSPFVEGFLGGWRLSVINFATSGLPVNLNYSPAAAFQVSSAPTYRPNVSGDPVLPEDQRSPAQWLNRATVSIPPMSRSPLATHHATACGHPRITT